MTDPRYPDIEVRSRSRNPLALVAAVRCALRQAHVPRREIRAFSSEAMDSQDPRRTQKVCSRWVRVAR